MIWADKRGVVYGDLVVVLYPTTSTFDGFAEVLFDPQIDPISGNEQPPAGLLEPLYGFGKVWCTQPGIRERVGWATAPEVAGVGRLQQFHNGFMLWVSQTNRTYVFQSKDDVLKVTIFDTPFVP